MKKRILLWLVFLPALAFAQFPAPDSFQIFVHYIIMDQSDWCDGQMIQGPAYCNLFIWQTPDTANTPATLTGYRIYKDSVLFLSTTQNQADTAGIFWGSFYVTAVYENPAGESEPSNVAVIESLPEAAGEIQEKNEIAIGFDLSNRLLIIQGAMYARDLRVYNMQGVQMLNTTVISTYQSLEGWTPGIYVVVVQDKYGRLWSKLVAAGF